MLWRKRCWRRGPPSIPIKARRLACSPPAILLAPTLDPNYGQPFGVLPTSHTFSAHMGWEDMTAAAPIAERAAAAAILADSEDPWAHFALGGVYLFTRR